MFLDADWKHFLKAARWSICSFHNRPRLIEFLCSKWRSERNPNHVLPCLSVRTGFDLFLRVMDYPPGTEVLMSAVNIPDMMRIVRAHGLKIISLDIDLETMAPKIQLFDTLVTEHTKVLVVASIYGRRFNMDPVVSAARSHGLIVVEDCAESFNGFDYLGYEGSDLALFSFGPIKHYTAFGGAIAKIRSKDLYEKMSSLYENDPVQLHTDYLKKIVKYVIVYLFLDCPLVTRLTIYLGRLLNIDHKKHVVSMMRGFPGDELIAKLRRRPCDALLAMMTLRLGEVDPTSVSLLNLKHEYVSERLPGMVTQVGAKADVRNHWLFPIVVVGGFFTVIVLHTLCSLVLCPATAIPVRTCFIVKQNVLLFTLCIHFSNFKAFTQCAETLVVLESSFFAGIK